MDIYKAIICVFLFLYVIPEMPCMKPNSKIGKRAETPLEIEVVVVADYSAFNKWYELLDPTLSHDKRVDIAKQNLTSWLGAIVHSTNVVYERLEADGLFISIKIVDLIIMTTVADSPWTETTKFKVNSTYMVDPSLVHPLFKVKSLELQKTIPHDHAMLFTRYTMMHGPNGTTIQLGNAYFGAECKPKSQSIIKDTGYMLTAMIIAHEIGHSLGCEHDGENNTCKAADGYCMEASNDIPDNKNRWIFSTCSVYYIRNFVDKLNRLPTNCLAKVNDNHPRPDLAVAEQQWVGKLYTVDEQCVISKGLGSYMCREVYHGNISSFCLQMYCYIPKKDSCYRIDAGDGTPCAAGSWCVSNNCVKDHKAPTVFDDICPFGEQDGLVHKNLTCKQIALKRPNDCLWPNIKQKCCISCKHVHTTAVSVDTQCREHIGPDSYMCRTAAIYKIINYSFLCSNLYCYETLSNGTCSAFTAYDKTPCGNKKWCSDGKCVHNENAPAASDDCPMGDNENSQITYDNLTCSQVRQHEYNLYCYNNYAAISCCKTCAEILRNVKGCEYGDTHEDCFTLVASQRDSHYCYNGDNAKLCCESCNTYKNASNVGCEYGDHSKDCASLSASEANAYICYKGNTAHVCCGTCGRYYNPGHKGCEYGDHVKYCPSLITDAYACYLGDNAYACCGSCGKYYNPSHKDDGCSFGELEGLVHKNLTCKQIVLKRPNDCLRQDIKQKCCISCEHAHTTAVSVDTQCREHIGPGSFMCRSSSAYKASNYSSLCSGLYCFNTVTKDSCSRFSAYDKTACGNKKWCSDGKCVYNANAPAVSDDCPMGDNENNQITYDNLTCAQVRQHKDNLHCYSNYTATSCCKTCADIRRNVKGCEYGDTRKDCFTLIVTQQDSHYCYTDVTAKLCCESCNKYKNASNVGCEYGDHTKDCVSLSASKADAYLCYRGNNADICCGTCGRYYNPAHKGCEYGDKLSGCLAGDCSTYTEDSRNSCCQTCRSTSIIG